MSISRIESSNREEFVMIKSRMAFRVFRRLQQSQTSDNRLRYARCCLRGRAVGNSNFLLRENCLCRYQVVENVFLQCLAFLPFRQ
jgi:hypothetical protein